MSSRYRDTEPNPTRIALTVFGAFIAVVVFFFVLSGFNKVEAGHVAVVTKSGKVVECRKPSGYEWDMPITTKLHQFDVRKKTYELVDGEPKDSGSKAEYVDYNIDTHTKEGVVFSAKLTVQYHIDPDKVCDIYQLMRSDERVQEQVVKFHVRAITPQVLNTYTADDLYFGNLAPISEKIKQLLLPRFSENGVVLDYFEIKRGTFADAYEKAVQGRANEKSNQELIKSQQETQRQQNEKDRLAAEGAAAVQLIDQQREADKAKIAAQSAADQQAIATESEANKVTTLAKANADAKTLQAQADGAWLKAQVDAMGGGENYVASLYAQAVANAGAIYLPSNAIPVIGLPTTVAVEAKP